ncbi:unnamed protein product [Prunus armeniaca]
MAIEIKTLELRIVVEVKLFGDFCFKLGAFGSAEIALVVKQHNGVLQIHSPPTLEFITLVVNLYFCECLRTCGFKPLIRGNRPQFAVYRKLQSVRGLENHHTANSRSVRSLGKNSRLPNFNHL